ncbi:hypothetical protein FN846DRAFT_887100 [Sphaerosporella brunnea]|uniref:Uncharacterized protein n=1 Tax=Sphaerosporella brunnea TaxID=1250544 RepID=A0A5J5F6U4_9PEZI|nr:hypothetical protein FN846DRAFT_887100 [Sphaerosporella brunnea]
MLSDRINPDLNLPDPHQILTSPNCVPVQQIDRVGGPWQQWGQRAAAPDLLTKRTIRCRCFTNNEWIMASKTSRYFLRRDTFMKQVEATHPGGGGAHFTLSFSVKEESFFASKLGVDAVEDYDSGTEPYTEPEVEGTAGDDTNIRSDHHAPGGADSGAEAVHDLYGYQTYTMY